ncbi:MAG TPA: c-type cytochrome biogenesis protein CcmI, partial [Rhizomicrobium sp.]
MLLWIILTFMVALGASGLTFALGRPRDAARSRATATSILAAQLADVDSQVAAGLVASDQAVALKIEIRRRILNEAREPESLRRPLPAISLPYLAVGVAGAIALAATGLYALLGRPDLATSGRVADSTPVNATAATHPGGDVAAMIVQLESRMRENPTDPEGWRMLGWSYLVTGRAADAAVAYGRAVALAPNNADYRSSEGEALVRASGGQVTPSALDTFRAALKDDPGDPRAKYYLALYKDQTGDHSGAMADWVALINSAPRDAPWLSDVRRFVTNVARKRGLNISGKLPPEPAPADSQNGPTPAQVAAANPMPAADRDAMIHAMVDRLAGELKTNPKNAEGWERLMRARMVLGETAAAAAAYRDASIAFADSPDVKSRLRNSA